MSTPTDTKEISGAVFTPSNVSSNTVQYIERLQGQSERAIGIGIPLLRDYFAPLSAPQLCSVIAQTSQYKSGFLHSWEFELARQLLEQGRKDEIIIHVSVEECVEEQGILHLSVASGEDTNDLARGHVKDWISLTQAAVSIGVIPIYRIGNSMMHPDDLPNLYLSNVIKAIEYLQNGMLAWRPRIAAIFFDYLQAFPFDPEHRVPGNDQRRLQVRDDVYRLRMCGNKFNCPVIVAVQAKQHLDGAPSSDWQMPGIYDGEESSSIAQRSDRIITMWMPKQTHPIGSQVKHNGYSFTVDENLIFVKVAKQRGRLPSGKTWKCRIDFQRNTIAPEIGMEER